MNKRGSDVLHSVIIFFILNLVFFAALIFFVSWASGGTIAIEKKYAEQIALIIDQAKPGTSIDIYIPEVYDFADRNRFDRLRNVNINNTENKVYVKVKDRKGHSYDFFTSNDILWGLEKKSKTLHLEIK